tara:strand:- start:483 stop:1508 length:1026 start_codon:yes stop_codon:yes gene_type:complete
MKISSAYVTALKQAIRDLGHDPAALISDSIDFDEVEFFALCDRAACYVDDPSFALRYGSALHLGSHGILGSALMSCRTLRQAAEFLVQHSPAGLMDSRVHFAFDRDNAILSMTPGIELPSAPNFLPEVFFMAAVNAIGEMVGAELDGCRVEFAFEPTMPEHIYQQYIGLPVVFGEPTNRFVGPRDAVNFPLAAAGNEVADIFVRQCSKLLIEKNRSAGCSAQVRRVLAGSKTRIATEQAIAEHLNMSGRTLRRRLAAENTTFREIQEAMRNDMAIGYLRETRLPIAEIGSLLGFDDVANFRRAFRRWNGCSPQSFRESDGTNEDNPFKDSTDNEQLSVSVP